MLSDSDGGIFGKRLKKITNQPVPHLQLLCQSKLIITWFNVIFQEKIDVNGLNNEICYKCN